MHLTDHELSEIEFAARMATAEISGKLIEDLEDLRQEARIGAMLAIERFDPARGVKLRTFLTWRARGAVKDKLREMDWVPRRVRKLAREGIEVEVKVVVSMDELVAQTDRQSWEDVLGIEDPGMLDFEDREEKRYLLTEALKAELTEQEREIIFLRYGHGCTYRQCGLKLGVTETRCMQIDHKARDKMRRRLHRLAA